MTHDSGHSKQSVEEREHGVFVPPNEQHVREDGRPTEPAAPASGLANPEAGDPDRVEAIGTAAAPQPATPLDTGTAEDAERAEDTAAEDIATRDTATRDTGTREVAAEDETRAVNADTDPVTAAADNVDNGYADHRHADRRHADHEGTGGRDINSPDMDAERADGELADPRDIDGRNGDRPYGSDVDDRIDATRIDGTNVGTDNMDGRNIDGSGMDASGVDRTDADTGDVDLREADGRDTDGLNADGRLDTDAIAVGTAPAPDQSTAPPAQGIWPAGRVDDLRGRWDAIQLRFVDDPQGVASDAKALVGEAVAAIREAVDRLEARLDEAVGEAADETEQLRQRVAHYRDVFESLLRG